MLLDTPLCEFGWKAPQFSLKDPDGREFSMSDFLGNKGLLVVFICNHCPYVKVLTKRLDEDTRHLMDQGINVLAVMSNDYQNYPEDSPENMKIFAKENGFSFPYLVDEDQSVGKAYNAVCTPDFFGLNSLGELQYRGRLDDQGKNENFKGQRRRELVEAMEMIAQTGKGPREQKPSMGCSIKWR